VQGRLHSLQHENDLEPLAASVLRSTKGSIRQDAASWDDRSEEPLTYA